MTWKALLLASAATALVSLAPSRADAFCRTWSCDPTKTTCPPDPLNPKCPGGNASDFRLYWPVPCVGFSLNQDASPQLPGAALSDKQQIFQEVADQAFATWQSANCGGQLPSLAFADLGTVECGAHEYNQPSDAVSQGNANILVFRNDSWPYANTNNTLALTTLTFNVDSGEIYDADMEINGVAAQTQLTVTNSVATTKDDLLSILTHEAGHFLGLAHAEDIHPDAVMHASYTMGTIKRELTADDANGICAVYPPDRVNLPTCDPTPRHGYSTQCAQDLAAPGNCSITMSHSETPSGLVIGCLGALGLLAARRRRAAR